MSLSTIEVALITGIWDDSSSDPHNDLAKLVVDGSFRDALLHSSTQALFVVRDDADISANLDAWFAASNVNETIRLLSGVACLHAFVQANWTGPDLDIQPLEVLTLPQSLSPQISSSLLYSKAVAELAYGGEPAYHLATALPFLRLAQILLAHDFASCTTASWWRLRIANIHGQVLDEPVPFSSSTLHSPDPLHASLTPSDPDLSGRLYIEQGLLQHYTGVDASAGEYFANAARTMGFKYELSGALGKRTKFQQTDVTQLILLAESRERKNTREAEKPAAPETLALNDDTLLERTEYTGDVSGALAHLDPNSQPTLHPLDQAILLSLSLHLHATSPADEIAQTQMSAYVERVALHPQNWSVHTCALLLRARLESGRTRTVERSTFQLQALVDQMPSADASVKERLQYIHDIPLPSKWEMERELALRYLSLGVVRSALEIFERLEMWEEVVKCYQAMEAREEGVRIVRDLLAGERTETEAVLTRGKVVEEGKRIKLDKAREAKLWCLFGDLEPQHAEEHYTRAWTVSGETSGRAMRSLGGYYFARGKFAEAIPCLCKAVAINPLVSRAWFLLGCAYTREEMWAGAREAFARCVSIDDQDAESWSNLASTYLRLGEVGQTIKEDEDGGHEEETDTVAHEDGTFAVPFSNKLLAHRALQHGIKFAYENWRMWMNYMIVSVDVGELAEACRAQGRVVEIRGKDGVDEDVLSRLVDAVTRAPANEDEAVEGGDASAPGVTHNPNEGHGLYPRVQDLFERTLLPRVGTPRVFRAYARLLMWRGRWDEALRAHLDAYRAGPAASWEKGETDLDKWREGAREVQDMVDVLRNFGPRVEDSRWVSQARSIVRTFVGRSKDFEDEPEYAELKELQDELKNES